MNNQIHTDILINDSSMNRQAIIITCVIIYLFYARKSRVTGFHPVSKKPFQKPSTVTHKYSDQSSLRSTEEIFPYSFVTENIDSLLRENTMKITGSKSHYKLDDVHGTYRKTNTDNELPSSISLTDRRTSKIPSSSEKPCITKDYESLHINACTRDSSCSEVSKQSSDSTGQSKWSQFLSTEPGQPKCVLCSPFINIDYNNNYR